MFCNKFPRSYQSAIRFESPGICPNFRSFFFTVFGVLILNIRNASFVCERKRMSWHAFRWFAGDRNIQSDQLGDRTGGVEHSNIEF